VKRVSARSETRSDHHPIGAFPGSGKRPRKTCWSRPVVVQVIARCDSRFECCSRRHHRLIESHNRAAGRVGGNTPAFAVPALISSTTWNRGGQGCWGKRFATTDCGGQGRTSLVSASVTAWTTGGFTFRIEPPFAGSPGFACTGSRSGWSSRTRAGSSIDRPSTNQTCCGPTRWSTPLQY